MKSVLFAIAIGMLALPSACAKSALPARGFYSMQRGSATDIAVESVNGAHVTDGSLVTGLGRGTAVEITGWAVDAGKRSAAGGVVALLDGHAPVEATYGGATPHVAAMLHTAAYGAAGYHLSVDTSKASLGRHRISLYVVDRNRREYLPTARTVNVLLVPAGVPRPIVIGDGHHLVGSFDQATTPDRAFAYGPEPGPVWLERTAALFIRGWAVDVVHRLEIEHYDLSIDGNRQPVVHPDDLRPELATTFPTLPKIVASYAGFTAIVPLARFRPGVHALTLIAIDPQTHERTPMLTNLRFATYDAKRLAKLIEPNYGPARPLRFKIGGRFAGSIDVVTTLSRAHDDSRQALPVWVDPHDSLLIRGWSADLRHPTAFPRPYVIIDGRARFPVTLEQSPPDMATGYRALPHALRMRAGYSVTIPMRGFSVGRHGATLAVIDPKTQTRTVLVRDFPFTIF